jgi:2-C-methyl-D-erythritol 4-phosphate cytidylyltransferase
MLDWSIDALRAAGITDIVVALPAEALRAAERGSAAPAPSAYRLPDGVIGVPGGAERSHSVRAALTASSGDPVLVHDAARPLVTPALITQSLAALEVDPDLAAAIVAAPVTDTIKRSVDGGVHAAETLARSELWAVQTPQVFRRDWLARALDAPDDLVGAATDDASLVEALGGRVGLVASGPENFKITTPHDLKVAELLLGERAAGR